jgi:hypothetical protein
VIVAAPMPAPVTCAGVAAVVAPCGMRTVAGVTVTFEASLLANATVTPPAGAGAGSVTTKAADSPSLTGVFAGAPIVTPVTFTVAVAVAGLKMALMFALAVITAVPPATAVTGTCTLVAPAAKVTLAGTVARVGSLELRLAVKPPAGAWSPVRFSARVPEAPALSDSGLPEKLIARGNGTSITAVRGGMLSARQVIVKLNGTLRLPAVAWKMAPLSRVCPPAKLPNAIGKPWFGDKPITFGAGAVMLVMLTIRRLIAVTVLVLVRVKLASARELMA